MSGTPQLPDLGKLTSQQKDELIVSLWRTVLALEGTQPERPIEPIRHDLADLRARIGHSSRRAVRGHDATNLVLVQDC